LAVPSPLIRVEISDGVGTIWLDRPDKRNAMTYDMWVALEEAAHQVDTDPAVHVVVLRGHGEHFCAGADITELQVQRVPSFLEVNLAAENALAAIRKPTIALVVGDCIGGGCALAIDCDLRIASSSARFGITPAKLGIVYPPASIERLVRQVGPSAAKFLLFSAELVDAHRALRIGLVDEVDSPSGAEARIADLGSTLASCSLLTQVATKEMVAEVITRGAVDPSTARRWADEVAAAGDMAEGVAAFAERRRPRFDWRPDQAADRRAEGS
jgi:enoyl-CoA hydratase/carnithine racemase